MEGQISGQVSRCRFRTVGAGLMAGLLLGLAANVVPLASADPSVVSDGDAEGDVEQSGEAASGDAVVGQVVGITSSGDVSVDARNDVEDSDARSGDAEGTNSVGSAFVGDQALEECPEEDVTQACPGEEGFVGTAIEADAIDAAIVHAGDNDLEIEQSATASTGDALAGAQVVGVTAAGIVDIILDNRANDVEARSGDAEANNVIEEAEVGDFVSFLCVDCENTDEQAIPSEINASTITAVIVHDGDNGLGIEQTAIASTGDAVAGSQVVGVVAASTGNVSIDARNRADDVDAKSGDAESDNHIEQAFAGDTVIDAPPCCEAFNGDAVASGIEANQIDAVIVHAGDNEVGIDQTADASSGDAVAGGQVIGAVGAGVIDIVADNTGIEADAESGDAEADNDIESAQAGDFVSFACEECPLPGGDAGVSSIEASTITAVIVHDGDNTLGIDQTAAASTGDAVAGSQVIGAVASTTGQISVDARNRGEHVAAKTGDAEAENAIGEAISGDTVLDAPCVVCEARGDAVGSGIEANQIDAVIVHAGDNEVEIDQTADASSGDAVAGGQVIGAVGAGVIDIVADNTGIDAEAESGDAEAENKIADAEAGDFVDFFSGCPDCPVPGDGQVDALAIDAATITAVIVQDGDNALGIDQAAVASSGDAVAGSQIIGAVASAGGDVSIDARNRGEDVEAKTGDAEAENTIDRALAGNAVEDFPTTTVTIGSGDNDLGIDQTADASSGDAVAGAQVIGAIGGNVDAVLDNVGHNNDSRSGDAEMENDVVKAQVGGVFVFEPTAATVGIPALALIGLLSLAVTRIGRRRRRAPVAQAQATAETPSRPVSASRVVTTGLIVAAGVLMARRLDRR